MGLLTDEAGADAYYGLPSGTLEALGASESGQGRNLGSIGNVFQVVPSTAANPGYGLSSVNGNDPYSVGAYLSALLHGPANGSLPAALSLYQGNGNNPGYTGTNAAMSNFLSGQAGSSASGGSSWDTWLQNPFSALVNALAGKSPNASAVNGAANVSDSRTIAANASTAQGWLSAIASALGASVGTRLILILLAITLIAGAIFLFGLRTVESTRNGN